MGDAAGNPFTDGVWQWPAGQGRWWARCPYCGSDLGSGADRDEAMSRLQAHAAEQHPDPATKVFIVSKVIVGIENPLPSIDVFRDERAAFATCSDLCAMEAEFEDSRVTELPLDVHSTRLASWKVDRSDGCTVFVFVDVRSV